MSFTSEGLDDYIKKIKKLETVLTNQEIEKEIGKQFTLLTKQTFNDKKSPFGKKWIPSLSNPDTLVDSSDLFNSVEFSYTKNQIIIKAGRGLDYAKIHNNGLNNMYKRQFLPNEGKIPKKWKDIANNIMIEKIKGVF